MKFYEAAQLASMSYRTGFPTDNVRISYDASTDTRIVAIFDEETQTLMISCRGTFSIWNWLFVNMRIGSRSGVHSGIANAIDRHEMALLKWLNKFPFSSLFLTGHSLGGALTNEIARRVWDLGYRSITVVTFGSVRSHDKEIIQSSGLGARTVRVVNNNDIVARLLGVSYDHIGRVMYFDRHGRPHRRMPWYMKLWDAIAGRLRRPVFDGISDHDMDDYIKLCSVVEVTVEEYLA